MDLQEISSQADDSSVQCKALNPTVSWKILMELNIEQPDYFCSRVSNTPFCKLCYMGYLRPAVQRPMLLGTYINSHPYIALVDNSFARKWSDKKHGLWHEVNLTSKWAKISQIKLAGPKKLFFQK